jgi:hypothetical protein
LLPSFENDSTSFERIGNLKAINTQKNVFVIPESLNLNGTICPACRFHGIILEIRPFIQKEYVHARTAEV